MQAIMYSVSLKSGWFGSLKNNVYNKAPSYFSDYPAAVGKVFLLVICLFYTTVSQADSLVLQSYSIRLHVAERTILGEDAPEDFRQLDISANFALPWLRHTFSAFDVNSRLMTSAGVFRGADKNALVLLVVPKVNIEHVDNGFSLDLGAGGAVLSRHRFDTQDFGGPFQFALTLGVSIPVYRNIGIGYRFLHYSDAGINGSDTTGADLHMVELFWNF